VLTSILLILTLPITAWSADESTRQTFSEANALYEARDYDGAIAKYLEVADAGVVDEALSYNLANAYFKVGAMGRAVLNYERALRLSPRDEDVRANLALIQSLLRDQQFIVKESLPKRVILWAYHNLSVAEMVWLNTALYLLLVIIILGAIFRDTRIVSGVYGRVSLASPGRFFGLEKGPDFALAIVTVSLLLAATSVSAYHKNDVESRRQDGVVVASETGVLGGPSVEATLQFQIHEGTTVTVIDTRPKWLHIQLPGELSGWIRSDSVERI